MREFRFRAWNGNRFLNSDEFAVLPNGELLVYDYALKKWTDAMHLNIDLMQYIGLKDKNNVEIYEGYIVRYKFAAFDVLAVVEYNKSEAQYVATAKKTLNALYTTKEVKGKANDFTDYLMANDHDFVEVVGNVFENPELLQEVEE